MQTVWVNLPPPLQELRVMFEVIKFRFAPNELLQVKHTKQLCSRSCLQGKPIAGTHG